MYKWILLCLVFLQSAFLSAAEFRGIWVDAFGPGFYDANQVKQLVSDCRKYNFNAVVVQMRRRGDAFYIPKSPNAEPRTTVLPPDFDALAAIIKECKTGEPKIEVHCWLVGHLVWAHHQPPPQREHVYNSQSNWLTRSSEGETKVGMGYFLDPGVPEANRWLRDVAADIVTRYDVDGLHWDYLGYPGRNSGYNPLAIRRYNQEFKTKDNPNLNDPKFCEWRRRQMTDFMRTTTADLLQIKPKLKVSVAAFSNHADSYGHRFVEWANWCKEGIVDLAFQMNFSPDTQGIFVPRAQFALTNQGVRAIYMGQGGYMNSPETSLNQLKLSREMGFGGTVLYSYRLPVLVKSEEPNIGLDEKRESVTVDNVDATMVGAWRTSKFPKFHGEDYIFMSRGTGTNYVEFTPRLPQGGEYDIYEWHVEGANRASDAPFEIKHSSGTDVVILDQKSNGSKWNFLGRFTFDAGSSGSVRVTDRVQNPEEAVVADAIRFVAVSEGEPIPERIVEGAELAKQTRNFFTKLKEQHQPTWQEVPALAWKANPKNGIIKGRVLRVAGGNSVYNAEISLKSLSGREQKSEAQGRFAFFEVPAGTHTISTKVVGYPRKNQTVEIRAGSVVEADLILGE